MPQWQFLLDRTVQGLDRLRERNQPVPDWVLGGGTALMLHAGHRLSKDIDAFINDPQYLGILSPRVAGEELWGCRDYHESANHLKLLFKQGEIDFIVAGVISDARSGTMTVETSSLPAYSHDILVEHPVEIALKKLFYRKGLLKVRDVFDIAVVDHLHRDLLDENLVHVAHLKDEIVSRVTSISRDYAARELAELEIADDWQPMASMCLDRVRQIAAAIPMARPTS